MTPVKTKATTVRFDPDWWRQLAFAAEILGVPKARFIHDAAIDRIVGIRTVEHLAGDVLDRAVHERVNALLRQNDGRLQRLELRLAAYDASGGRR